MQAIEAVMFDSQDYLAWEEVQEQKHEFSKGEIFAMGGARREHVVAAEMYFLY